MREAFGEHDQFVVDDVVVTGGPDEIWCVSESAEELVEPADPEVGGFVDDDLVVGGCGPCDPLVNVGIGGEDRFWWVVFGRRLRGSCRRVQPAR